MLNKKESIAIIKKEVLESAVDVEIIKASIKNGGGLLKVLPDQSIRKIMLRRSRNYSDPTLENINEEEILEYSYMTWFTIDSESINHFDYLLFFTYDGEKKMNYSFVFTAEEFKTFLENKTFEKVINIYIQQVRATGEWIITRLGKNIEDIPINVTAHLNNWKILEE